VHGLLRPRRLTAGIDRELDRELVLGNGEAASESCQPPAASLREKGCAVPSGSTSCPTTAA
jgi:hypothetical protein